MVDANRVHIMAPRQAGMGGFRGPKGPRPFVDRSKLPSRIQDYLATALGWPRDKLIVHTEYDNREARTIIHVWLSNRQGVTFRIVDSEMPHNSYAASLHQPHIFPTDADLAIIRLLNQAEPADGPDPRRQSKKVNKDLSLKH